MSARILALSLAVVCLAPPCFAAPGAEERKLDPALKLLLRSQEGRAAVSEERAAELLGRLRGPVLAGREGSRARSGGRLPVLIRYSGESRDLERVLRVRSRLGRIVSGSLDPGRLGELARLPGVEYVQLGQVLRAEAGQAGPTREAAARLDVLASNGRGLSGAVAPTRATAFTSGSSRTTTRTAQRGMTGAGALVAFVDTGVDVFHHDFRKVDGTTRIRYLLDLSVPGDVDDDGDLDGAGPFGGTEYTEADINAAILGGTFGSVDTAGHGTHGLSIAAGDEEGLPGLAPEADLLVVKATREAGSLGFVSTDVIDALAWVEEKAALLAMPCVVNLSLGTLFSSHDGRSLEEQAVDSVVGPGKPGRAAVVAAGNSSDNRGLTFRHLSGRTYAGLEVAHELVVPPYTPEGGRGNDRVLLDLWYEGRDRQRITVTAPDGTTSVSAAFGEYADVATVFGDVFIANVGGASPLNGDVEALVLIDDWSGPAPGVGTWTLKLEGEQIGESGVYHGWLAEESSVGGESPRFAGPGADGFYLVGKPGSAYHAITVGSYARHQPGSRYLTSWTDVNAIGRVDDTAVVGDVSDFSSPGRTRDGRTKPEVAAPGERVTGAVSREAYPGVSADSIYVYHPWPEANALIVSDTPDHRFGVLQGTSFSAPVVTGIVARVLSTDPTLDAVEVRNALINTAVADGFTGVVPNELWGWGKVDEAVGGAPLPSDLRITVERLPGGVKGEAYNVVLTASGGTLPYTWALAAGTLPPGVNLDPHGLLSGAPTTADTYVFTLRVTDVSVPAKTAERGYEVEVLANPELSVVTPSLPAAPLGVSYEQFLEAEGGQPPYAWTLAGGEVPPGLTFLANGRIEGIPTELGRWDFTVRVTDAAPAMALKSLKIKVVGPGGEDWEPLGKATPTVNQIAVDPEDPEHVIVSTRNIDAVFETTDGGESWHVTSVNNNLNTYANRLGFSETSRAWAITTSGVAFLWDVPSGFWVARGEAGNSDLDFAPGYVFTSGAAETIGVFVTVDEGLNWTYLGSCGDSSGISVLRSDPACIYAAGSSATCSTTDFGATWADVTNQSEGALDIRVSQADAFDVVKVNGSKAWWSDDGGRRWTEVVLGSAVCCMDRSLVEPWVAIAGTSAGLYKSSDGGRAWRRIEIRGENPAISAVAIDPVDPDRLWVATPEGVVFSADGGISWSLRSSGLIRRVLSAVATSPASPTDVMVISAEGPYVSRTSGDAWTLSKQGLANLSLSEAQFSAADPNLLYVVNPDGVFRSDNRAVTWTEPNPGFGDGYAIKALAADPFDGNVALSALSGTRGVYRTSDRGSNWTPVDEDLPFVEPRDLVFARDVEGRAFVSMATRGVWRTENRGTDWTSDGLDGSTVDELEVAPSDSAYLYARVGTVLQFRNPSVTQWTAAETGPGRPPLDIAVDALDPQAAYVGVDHSGTAGEAGGIYKTTDGGRNWTRLTGLLDSHDVVSVATHPTQPGILWAATQSGGVFRSSDGGVTWTEQGNYGTVADLTNVNVPKPGNPALLFAGTEGYGVQASADGGKTYVPKVNGLLNLYVNALAFDPDDANRLYAATDGGIYVSEDSGESWGPTGLTLGEVTDLVVDELDGALKRMWGTVRGEGVACSTDGGTTFTTNTAGLTSLDLTSLELEVRGALKRMWGTTKGGDGVVYSDDHGQTWVSAAGNGLTDRRLNDLVIEQGALKRMWGTTDSGVFFSEDDGQSWSELSLGLPSSAPITSVVVDPNTQEVVVSAYGASEGGVYRGGNVTGIWTPYSSGLSELRVKKLTTDGGHVVDGETNGTTFYAATAGDGVWAAEIRSGVSAPSIPMQHLPDGVVRQPYTATLVAHAGTPPYFWSVAAGMLPPGLGLHGPTGVISGQPGQAGRWVFTVQVSDQNQRTDRKELSITVRDPDQPKLSIADVSVSEGDGGTSLATFTVTLSPASASTVTVSYATADGMAVAGSDYEAAAGTATFVAGVTSQPVQVTVNGDVIVEGDETFTVNLSGATNATIADAQAVGTIVDDDELPTVSISDAEVEEGHSGTASLTFTVTLSRVFGTGVSVDWATSDGTATGGSDYVSATGQVTFLAGTTSQPVTVTVNGDTAEEPDETVLVGLSNPVNAVLADSQGTGTIWNDDGRPTLSVADVTVREGLPEAIVIVRLSPASTGSVSVRYATSDGTATNPADYATTSGELVFVAGETGGPGERVRAIVVPLTDDGVDEDAETFTVDLYAPNGAEIGDSQATVTVVDDDWRKISITPFVSVTEGNSGSAPAVFTVTLSAPASLEVRVDYSVQDITTAFGSDYSVTAGTLVFPPGTTSREIAASVLGDTLDEADEEARVRLANPVNASYLPVQTSSWRTLSAPLSPPPLYIPASAYDEANDRLIVFGGHVEESYSHEVWILAGAGGEATEVSWIRLEPSVPYPSSGYGAAAAYDAATNRLIVHGGFAGSGPLAETWVLRNANGLGGAPGWTRLVDAPEVRGAAAVGLDPGSNRLIVFGGVGAQNQLRNDVWILTGANGEGTATWQELSPTGTPPAARETPTGWYDAASNSLVVFGGNVSGSAFDETWVLTHANGLGGTPEWKLLNPLGPRPTARGYHGMVYDPDSDSLVVHGGVTAASNYTMLSDAWRLEHPTGAGGPPTWSQIAVEGAPMLSYGAATAFSRARGRIIEALGAPIPRADVRALQPAQVLLRILDDDPLPSLSVGDAVVAEGDSGTTDAVFALTLTPVSGRTVTVSYATADDTARSGPDYQGRSGVVVIPAGSTSAEIRVPVVGEPFPEQDEDFLLTVATSQATVVDGQAVGTITNDDVAGARNPVPFVSSLAPTAVVPGGPDFELAVRGTGFVATSVVRWNGSGRPTTYVSAKELRATIGAADIATATTTRITVFTPTPGGGPSLPMQLPVSAPTAVPAYSRVNLTAADGPGRVAVGDFDGDGHADLAVANQDGSSVSLWLGHGDGTFGARTDVALGASPRDLVAADLDQDGDVDLVSGTSSGFSVLRGNGDGTFTATNAPLAHPAHDLSLGDVNGDGWLDLAMVSRADATFGVALGLGDGTFAVPYDGSTPYGGPTVAELVDLNGDGELDLLVANDADYYGVHLFPGRGDGTFEPALGMPGNFIPSLGTGDFNGDGNVDVVFPATYGLGVALGDGTGGFSGGFESPAPRFYAVTAVDLNSDGHLDPGLAGVEAMAVTLGDGEGRMSGLTTFPLAPNSGLTLRGVAAADFDEDGRVDLVASDSNADQVSVFLAADAAPVIAIGDVSVQEGHAGPTSAVFALTLSSATAAIVTASYATADGTAAAPGDYLSATGIVTFTPGQTRQTISVSVSGDRVLEPDETFFLNLSNPSGATIYDSQGQGTILNDETGYILSVADASATEGGTVDFTVTLAEASPDTVTVQYATADGTAVSPFDYAGGTGTVTFPAGTTSQVISVTTVGDVLDEPDETFTVTLSVPAGAVIGDGQAVGTIQDDDPTPTLSIGDVSVPEGPPGQTVEAEFAVQLSAASGRTVTVVYSTADGSAVSGVDYEATSGVLTFTPGNQGQVVRVTVNGDATAESSENFFVNLSSPANAAIGDGQGRGEIEDDDTVARAELTTPVPGTTLVGSVATFGWTAGTNISRYWLWVGRSPGAYDVYNGDQGLGLSKTVTGIPTDGSSVWVRLWSLGGTTWLFDDHAYGTSLPALAVGNATVVEGDSGTAEALFQVALSAASGDTVTVSYATADGTAVAPGDYTAKTGVLTFPPGTTAQPVSVQVAGDRGKEQDETFTVELSSPANAAIVDGTGLGTITDDDEGDVGTDLDGNGTWDLLWRNASTGENAAWLMDGATLVGGAMLETMPLEWAVGAIADLDGSGRADVVWRNQSTGQTRVWFMDGTVVSQTADLPAAASPWQLEGAGDFDRDGREDLLWREGTTGETVAWLMDGATVAESKVVGTLPASWLPWIGDLDGDGDADLLWKDSGTGQTAFWLMEDGGIASGAYGITVTGWEIAGLGDFDGDGKSDVWWRDAPNGANAIWFMEGTALRESVLTVSVWPPWTIALLGDLDGDGQADVVWREPGGGDNAVWFMDAAAIVSGEYLPALAGSAWQVALP